MCPENPVILSLFIAVTLSKTLPLCIAKTIRRTWMLSCFIPVLITLIILVSTAAAQSNNELFEKMVGHEVRMDPD